MFNRGKLSRQARSLRKGLYWRKHGYPAGAGKLVIVPGVQRSGTNMLMDILDRSALTDVYHETDERAFEAYSLRGVETLRLLQARSRAPFVVLKALQDGHRIAELRREFPDHAVLWIYRDFRDMVNSHLVSWPGFNERLDEIMDPRSVDDWRAKGIPAPALEKARRHYDPGLNTESCVALFWYLRNSLVLDRGLDRDPNTLMIKYETLVTRPDGAVRAVCEHLGLTYESDLHSIVHARSIAKRPSPDIEPGVARLCGQLLEAMDASIGHRHG